MKTRACFVIAGLATILVGCGGGSGDTGVRAAYEKNIEIMEEFSNAMDKAGNANQVVAALNRYTREIEELGPRLIALREEHPELAEMNRSGRFPEELKDLEEKFAAMGMTMMRAMAKVMQYEQDPTVMEAQQRMIEAAQKVMPPEDY